MKKMIFGGIVILGIGSTVAFNVNFNTHTLSDLALKNVEALARGEGDEWDCCTEYDLQCDMTGDPNTQRDGMRVPPGSGC